MKGSFNFSKLLLATAGVCLAATGAAANGNNDKKDDLGPFVVGEQGVFYAGGTYDVKPPAGAPTTMSNQAYVFYQIPASPNNHSWNWKRTGRVPIIMIHGSQQTGANFLGTPDGRPGWAAFYVKHGWPVYVIDQPGRGKSGYFPNAYGPQAANPNPTTVQQMFTAPELTNPLAWPQAARHTQWPGGPGSGVPGEAAFDQFFASQVANMPNGDQALALTTAAVTALIKKIGPSVIITHSMTGPESWFIPQANPGMVKAILAVEPTGNSSLNGDTAPGTTCGLSNVCLNFDPPVSSAADLGLTKTPPPAGGVQGQPAANLKSCWLQSGKTIHQPTGLKGTPILIQTGEASYHSTYDYCTSAFLDQAGVPNTYVYLPTVHIRGNGHMQMLEMNNLDIAAFDEKWLSKVLHVHDHDVAWGR
jgi:pimeloyl-ACP methyl ester carboxylesterase